MPRFGELSAGAADFVVATSTIKEARDFSRAVVKHSGRFTIYRVVHHSAASASSASNAASRSVGVIAAMASQKPSAQA